jgi:dTMP kinase
MAGILITHEGPDGSGKATQAALLRSWLERQGVQVSFYAFPTYEESSIAGLIRTMLHNCKEEWTALPWESRALLYIANRIEYRDRIYEDLKEGKTVLCDRYAESNFAHLAGLTEHIKEREHIIEKLSYLEFEYLGMPRPNIIFLHTMLPRHRQELIRKREGGAGDVNEQNNTYLSSVEESYLMMAKRRPDHFCHIPSDRDGSLEEPQEIHQRVVHALQGHPVWKAYAVSIPTNISV